MSVVTISFRDEDVATVSDEHVPNRSTCKFECTCSCVGAPTAVAFVYFVTRSLCCSVAFLLFDCCAA